MDKLMGILKTLHPNVDFTTETDLVNRRIIDSFDLISLVQELSDAFDVEIDLEHMEPENFNSLDAMVALLQSLGVAL